MLKLIQNDFMEDASASVEYVYFEEKASKEDEDKVELEYKRIIVNF